MRHPHFRLNFLEVFPAMVQKGSQMFKNTLNFEMMKILSATECVQPGLSLLYKQNRNHPQPIKSEGHICFFEGTDKLKKVTNARKKQLTALARIERKRKREEEGKQRKSKNVWIVFSRAKSSNYLYLFFR